MFNKGWSIYSGGRWSDFSGEGGQFGPAKGGQFNPAEPDFFTGFSSMFKGNLLTFNPGWDDNAKNLEVFDDVRLIQKQLKSNGFAVSPEADEKTTGPAYFMVSDPDGNVLLFDQHR